MRYPLNKGLFLCLRIVVSFIVLNNSANINCFVLVDVIMVI